MKDYLKGFLKKDNIRRILLYALYLFLVMVFQDMVLTHIRILGVCAFILPAAVVAVAMYEGTVAGTVFGLVLGMLADMFYVDTVVFYTMLLPALAFATGFLARFFLNRSFYSYMVITLLILLITGFLQMLKVSLSDTWTIRMIGVILLQTLWTLPLAALTWLPAARWIE